MDDNKIIALYFDRNEQAIKETKAKYGKYCFSIAFNILSDREDAEECESDTYLGAWNSIPPNKPNVFSAYIGRITRNLSLKRLREKNAAKRIANSATESLDELGDCIPDGQSFAEEIEKEELAEIINSFLLSLDMNERIVFVRRYWYCDSISDICQRYDFGQSKAKMMLLRTREKLLTYLLERGVFI